MQLDRVSGIGVALDKRTALEVAGNEGLTMAVFIHGTTRTGFLTAIKRTRWDPSKVIRNQTDQTHSFLNIKGN